MKKLTKKQTSEYWKKRGLLCDHYSDLMKPINAEFKPYFDAFKFKRDALDKELWAKIKELDKSYGVEGMSL